MKPTKRQRALALIALIVQDGIVGRTRLQKLSYLVNVAGWNSFDDYRFHYYGPFSDSLTNYVEEMRELGWIQESPVETGKGNTLYKYSSAEGNITKALISRMEDPKLVSHTEGLLSQLGKFSSDELEIMASLVFLYENEKLEGEELIKRTKELKPRFSESEIRDSTKIFRILSNFVPRYKRHTPITA
jgi:uncharacterized protein